MKTIKQRLEQWPKDPEVPFYVHRFIGSKDVSLFNGQVSFGEGDYASIEQIQGAIEWYVHQLGGTVKW